MGKIKAFVKKHKVKFIIGGSIVVGIAGVLIFKNRGKTLDLRGRAVITWTPSGNSVNLDNVKEFLDVTKDDSSMFAIFREGADPTKYAIIELEEAEVAGF